MTRQDKNGRTYGNAVTIIYVFKLTAVLVARATSERSASGNVSCAQTHRSPHPMDDQSSETAPAPAPSPVDINTDQDNADTNVEVDENDREENEHEGTDTNPAKQCRICLDGDEDPALGLGRLIRPCLCKGSMTVRTPFLPRRCDANEDSGLVRTRRLSEPLARELGVAPGLLQVLGVWLSVQTRAHESRGNCAESRYVSSHSHTRN